ncbi:hypothetical protein AB0C22_15975 [Micromonospora sp. NPDC048894]|uniref:hypothetical protein n=1 Tax=Micromonospora sp. NPDC048894 TaxID=3155493 RepID=UPI0033CE0A6C
MELHRERGRQVLAAVCVLAGTVLLATGGGPLRTTTALGASRWAGWGWPTACDRSGSSSTPTA